MIPDAPQHKDIETTDLVILARGHALLAPGRGLLREENGVDVREHAARGDSHVPEELVELLVVLHSEGDVAGNDAALLVVAGSISGELQDLGAEVLEDGCHVDGRAGAHARGVLPVLEVTADTAYGELKPGLGRFGLGLSRAPTALALALACS